MRSNVKNSGLKSKFHIMASDSTIESQIKKLGQRRDITALQEFIKTVSLDEIKALIDHRLSDPIFLGLWNFLMKSFVNTEESCKKFYEFTIYVLQKLENLNVSNAHTKSIISRFAIELPKFKTEYLVKFIMFCTKCIQIGNIVNLSWVDLLPELLNIICEHDTVDYNEITYTGSEYKTNVINTICMLDWSSNIVTPLTIMFIDTPLTKDEHYKVVIKLVQHMESLTCTELPVFINHMLKLCKYVHSKCIFFKLQQYFHIRIYSSAFHGETDTNSMDLIESVPEQAALDAESTVLFHIHEVALLGHESIKEYLTSLKNLTNAYEFILHQFQITVLLTISKFSHYEDTVFDIIKSSVSKSLREEEKQLSSYWFREILPNRTDIKLIFQQIIDFNNNQKEVYLKQGLTNLGFVFLNVYSGFGKDALVEKQWNLGIMLLLKIIEINRNNLGSITQTLCNSVVTKSNVIPYTDCLSLLCKSKPFIIIEHQNCIIELMESLIQSSSKTGILVLEAIVPLTKISSTFKDQLILILQKALFSRAIETRQVAVSGFIQLLKTTKIIDPTALSLSGSSSASSHSLMTQISLSRTGHFRGNPLSNESVCLEILNILKRCFLQSAEVRTHLYEGLYEAIRGNPQLLTPILDFLFTHFLSYIYYQTDSSTLPPLNFHAIMLKKDVDVILQEPLGKMVQLIAKLITYKNSHEPDSTITKFSNIIDEFCVKMSKCELVHFELDDGTDLLDILPESQEKCLILKEAMVIYTALIDYKLNSWSSECNNHANEINLLFQCYGRLLQFAKGIKKNKKSDKRKAERDKNSTTSSETSSATKKGDFKTPNVEMNSESLMKALQLLYLPEVNWATSEQVNILKSNKEFHQYIIQAIIYYIEIIKNQKISHTKNFQTNCSSFETMANILYNNCLKRFNELLEFDNQTALLVIEVFNNIMQLTFLKSNDVTGFLCGVNEDESERDLTIQLSQFIELFISIFEESISLMDDSDKKICLVCLNILTLLTSKIPNGNDIISSKIMDWLKNYAKSNIISNKQIITSFATLWFNLNLKFKTTTTLFENVVKNLSKIYGTITTEQDCAIEYQMINETTSNTFLQVLCNTLKTILDDFDWVIARMKAEYAVLTYPGGSNNTEKRNDDLKQKERDVCCHMCWIINIANILSDLMIPPQSECVLKNLTHIFTTLDSLTKYFVSRSTKENLIFEDARFSRVVKLAGKELSRTVYSLILYIDENQTPKETGTQTKKQATLLKNKVLRETKLLPKLVYEMEQFSKSVIQLSTKTKVDLTKYVGQGTARDFRILNVEDVLKKLKEQAFQAEDSIGDSNTDIPSSSATIISSDEDCSGQSKRMRLL